MRCHILSIFLVILCLDANADTILLPDFTIEIPKGWVKASHEELRAFEEKERTVSGTSNYYSFGVQPSGRDAFFLEPPFILGYFRPVFYSLKMQDVKYQ